MKPLSLGTRTDLIFSKFQGEVLDRGDHLVILTRNNPTFYWGNYLLFAHPPQAGDLTRWSALFEQEIVAQNPAATHRAFGWDSVNGETGMVQPFLDAGFHLNQEVVLAATAVHLPRKYNTDVTVRPITTPAEWSQVTANQIAGNDVFPELPYTLFKERQMANYQAMAAAGLGHWFGAFMGDELVADCGLFKGEGGIGRFQAVGTHPDWRRRGICGALIYHTAQYGFTEMGLTTEVMVADENYHAAAIYESVGFVAQERQAGLEKW